MTIGVGAVVGVAFETETVFDFGFGSGGGEKAGGLVGRGVDP